MSDENEAVVRRFYEEMNNGRNNDLAAELFTADHKLDGKIAETWEVWDTLGFLQQLGVVPAMG